MNRFVLLLTAFVLAEMAYTGIDNALTPYEAAFFTWGGYAALAFICWLFGYGLDQRLHRMEQGKGREPQG